MRRSLTLALAFACLAAPLASAHGALTINQFDVYALSDFEGHEDSFPWEGFEIWDVYAGDGYHVGLDSHAVYFKANLAGDGTLRPTGSQAWQIDFRFTVGNASYERRLVHDGSEVTSDFDALEWQIADGNVFQLHAWVAVPAWLDLAITDLVVVSSVDDSPRDIAPGGFYDPLTGAEVPFSAPATPLYPAMGEGRIVDTVPLTGADKFLEVAATDQGAGAFTFQVTNPLEAQGQHFLFQAAEDPAWTVSGSPEAQSLEPGASMTFELGLTPGPGTVAPLPIDLMTDIGGRQTFYAVAGASGVTLVDDPAAAKVFAPTVDEEAAGLPVILVGVAMTALALRRRQ